MTTDIDREIDRLLNGDQHDPFLVLGIHYTDQRSKAAIIRTFQPHADKVFLLHGDTEKEMFRSRDQGLFEIFLPSCPPPFTYRYRIVYHDGNTFTTEDPYNFYPQFGDMDRHLFNNGTHYEIYRKLGAHITTINDIDGTIFRVWAPSARRVSVVGNFNSWDNRVHQMRVLDKSGIWELFIPRHGRDEIYKFDIRARDNNIFLKTDPYQFFGELRPRNASIVKDLSGYNWRDDNWLANRGGRQRHNAPLSIYELHLGSWRRDPADPRRLLTYRELAHALVPYVKKIGFTHIELMPVMEHPLDESWGYQVTGYFSITSRHGTPEEFMYFVDQCHQHDIGVILDWVPAHFPTDIHSLGKFDGTPLYEHEDPSRGAHPDWGTLIFNYGRKEVSNFLIASALFWLDTYHIDGLRVDAVASMLYLDYSRHEGEWQPNLFGGNENLEAIEFLKHFNSILYDRFPDILVIAEESTSYPAVSAPTDMGGLGFGFKWNMGWMNDILDYFCHDPAHRKYHHNSLTFSMLYAFSENYILPLSHDEVVHGKRSLLAKMPGDIWHKFANLRLLFLWQWTHPGKKLLFMGGEFGQWAEWFSQASIDWHHIDDEPLHGALQDFVASLNGLYTSNTSLWQQDSVPAGFMWLDCDDNSNSTISFARFAEDRRDHLVCLLNFTPQVIRDYRLLLPENRHYREIFNSDAQPFGGSNVINPLLETVAQPDKQPHVIVSVPPLAGIILQPE